MRIGCLLIASFLLFPFFSFQKLCAQPGQLTIVLNPTEEYQRITGFGASLAYYENWLTAHPNRSEIYDIIFNELSLDILRVRNTYGYDAEMINRVKQFVSAARNSLGHPIDILVTSWGPPAYLKNNHDKNNGGTLKYSIENGQVKFDYNGFAQWWNQSLDDYEANGIYPTYVSIQNEPDFKASWESCLFKPAELINSSDTIAGYNKALDAVYNALKNRSNQPKLVGPECVGIGYNAVENYINALDLSKLYAIGHHLYHGAESGTVENDPFTSTNYKKVGNFYPEVPHFQTEYSRADWYSLAAMMMQSLVQEMVSAFLYWDLIWTNGKGLVNLHFPWDRRQWTNANGFNRTKDFYVFKHYSAFIHPGWKRINTSFSNETIKSAAFINPSGDSASCVIINRSLTDTFLVKLNIPGFKIKEANCFSTTETENFHPSYYLADNMLKAPPKSVNTVALQILRTNTSVDTNLPFEHKKPLEIQASPNPFTCSTSIHFVSTRNATYRLEIFNSKGERIILQEPEFFLSGNNQITFNRNRLFAGVYYYRLTNNFGETGSGKLVISD